MLFLPFIFHAGIGVLLLVHQFRNSPTIRRLKVTLVPTIAASCLPLFIDSHFGDDMPESLPHGVTYLVRSTIALAASLISPSGPPSGSTDVVLYDLHAMGFILDRPLKHRSRHQPRFDPPPVTRTEYEQYEAVVEEEPWVTYIPLHVEDFKPSSFIDPDHTASTFATTEEPAHSLTSPRSDPTSAIGEPAHQSSRRRPSRKRKSSRSAKKESAGQKSQSRRKGRKSPTPTTWCDRLFKMVSSPRSYFAKLGFHPAAHFVRSWLRASIHQHIKALIVFSAISYVGVEVVLTVVEHDYISLHPAIAIYDVCLMNMQS
ncbi:hypothetical protein BS17DRAFT_768490 [Gyrodon lividus]|nr:hypothetical protein BS17DRAFT_768490 [Gyrodon lividus]